jgi:splicing factor 3A subunit 1
MSEFEEHMKLELMDPKWRENKLKRDQALAMNTLASGEEIARNLDKYASGRKDILTGGDGQSAPVNKVIWDGQSEHISRTTANIAM